MVSSSSFAHDATISEDLLRQIDLPNYISDVHDLLKAAIAGNPLQKRELEKVSQTIINRAIEDWGDHAAYAIVAARTLTFISEREEAKAREVRKAWGEPDPPFALRSVMTYMQEIIGEKEAFKQMKHGWEKWYSFLSCVLHFFQFNSASPVLRTSIPTMLTTQTWQALRELIEWSNKKTNYEKARMQMNLAREFLSKSGKLLNELDKKHMEEFANLARDKFGDPNLSDRELLEILLDILEMRASWKRK